MPLSLCQQPRRGAFGIALLLVIPALTLPGCGKGKNNTVKVSGKVLYNGAPVSGGTISLYPVGGGNFARAMIGPDGSFSLGDVPPGEKQVAVETESIRGMNTDYAAIAKKNHKGGSDPDTPAPKANDSGVKYVHIPPKYASPATSHLTWDVKPGNETREFNLK